MMQETKQPGFRITAVVACEFNQGYSKTDRILLDP